MGRSPNPIIRLTREAPWAQQHPSIMGPDNSFYYLGPENRPGYVIYGNNRTNIQMANLMKKKSEGSSSRYFTTMGGRECKWKKGSGKIEVLLYTFCSCCFAALTRFAFSHVLQCIDGRTTLAVWELSDPDDEHSAKLLIKPAGMSIITEILTTLTLNLMAQTMGWPDA